MARADTPLSDPTRGAGTPTPTTGAHRATGSGADRWIGVVLLALSVAYMAGAWALPRFQMTTVIDAWVFPMAVGLVLAALSLVLILRPGGRAGTGSQAAAFELPEQVGRPVLVLLALVAYALLLDPLGFILSTSLFFLATSAILGWRRWLVAAAVAVGSSVAVYAVFTRLLAIPLPPGPLPW